jgi:hypothetical protein
MERYAPGGFNSKLRPNVPANSETITFSTSECYPRICHRSVVLLKH